MALVFLVNEDGPWRKGDGQWHPWERVMASVESLGKGEGVKAVSLQWVGILLAVQLTGQLKMWLIG